MPSSDLAEALLRMLFERGVPPGEILLALVEMIDRVVAASCPTRAERVELIYNVANMLVEHAHGVAPEAYLANCH